MLKKNDRFHRFWTNPKGNKPQGVGDTRGPRKDSMIFHRDEVPNEVDHVSLVTALGERPDLKGWRPVLPAPLQGLQAEGQWK